MIIKCCLLCKFHQIKEEDKEGVSYCQKENCSSELSRCILKALYIFLKQESSLLSATPGMECHR